MASTTRIEYSDDISGASYSEGEGETLTFAFDGQSYEIDLAAKNAKKMRDALAFYVDHGRTSAATSGTTRAARSGGGRLQQQRQP